MNRTHCNIYSCDFDSGNFFHQYNKNQAKRSVIPSKLFLRTETTSSWWATSVTVLGLYFSTHGTGPFFFFTEIYNKSTVIISKQILKSQKDLIVDSLDEIRKIFSEIHKIIIISEVCQVTKEGGSTAHVNFCTLSN